MLSQFIRKYFVIKFLQLFYILVSDDGFIQAETCCNLPSTADNVYVVIDG